MLCKSNICILLVLNFIKKFSLKRLLASYQFMIACELYIVAIRFFFFDLLISYYIKLRLNSIL